MRRWHTSTGGFGLAVALAALVVTAEPALHSAKFRAIQPSIASTEGAPAACSPGGRQIEADCAELWILPADLADRYREHDVFMVDVRAPASYRRAHLPGAVSINLESLHTLAAVLRASDVRVVVYGDGASGDTSLETAAALRRLGVPTAQALDGGFDGWVADGRVVVTPPSAELH